MTSLVQDDPANSEKLDAIREMQRSPGYELFEGRIHDELDRKRKALEEPKDMGETASLRGAIGALRMVLSIPEILETEFRKED